MKNKKLLWILIPAVLGVWGLIAFRIIGAVQNSNTAISFQPTAYVESVEEIDTVAYELKLNYQDPFLKHSKPIRKPAKKQVTAGLQRSGNPQKVVQREAPLRWPSIAYHGTISGTRGQQCIMDINGQSVFMTEGQVVNELALLSVYGDSVQVEFMEKEKRIIPKQ